MLCENCNQNEATIYYTEIVNGVKDEHHLCAECAAKAGVTDAMHVSSSDFAFVKLLTGLLASSGLLEEQPDNPMVHVKCPQCGMNFREFTRVGKFGCAECYNVFGPLIEDNMKKLQGSIEHKGKKYRMHGEKAGAGQNEQQQSGDGNASRIAELSEKLQEAVELENFEDAARYRDEIKALKRKDG